MENSVSTEKMVEPDILPPIQEPSLLPTHDIAPEHKATLFGAILKTVFVPVAALAGLWVAQTEVRGSANRKALKETTLKDVAENHANVRNKLQADRITERISKEEFRLLEREELRAYRHAVDTRMKHMGYNFFNKFNYVTRSEAQKAIIDGVTVAGITIGALFAIGNSKALMEFFSDGKNKEKDDRAR